MKKTKRPKYLLNTKIIFSTPKQKKVIIISNYTEEKIIIDWLHYYTGCPYIKYPLHFKKYTPNNEAVKIVYYEIFKNGDITRYCELDDDQCWYFEFQESLTSHSEKQYLLDLNTIKKDIKYEGNYIKYYYNIHDLKTSNDRCLDYYKKILNYNVEDSIIEPLIGLGTCDHNNDVLIIQNIKNEKQEVLSKYSIRQELRILIETYKFGKSLKNIDNTMGGDFDFIDLIQSPINKITDLLTQHEWLIPPFAKMNNLPFID